MFGTYFYNQTIRKSVALFGTMFNNLYIMRTAANGDGVSTIKVPLSYAPKRKYMERLLENPDLDNDTKVAVKLPRMSFEIISIGYDPTRQLAKTNNVNYVGTASTNRTKIYTPAPYNIGFQLNIYAKSHDDALQVVEQIIPFFSPQYTLTIKPLVDFPSVKEDVPLVLNSVTFSDDYEGAVESRRTIIYTLDFEMKISFYGGSAAGKIIRKAIVDIHQIDNGMKDSDQFVESIRVTPDPANATADSDYGFTTTIYGALDSA
jgi:hypothetical protein